MAFRRRITAPSKLKGRAEIREDPADIAALLRRQLAVFQPSVAVADPLEAHPGKLKAIRAVVLTVEEVAAKFKYGGNVDDEHREAVIDRLRRRGGAGDLSAAARTEHRLATNS